MNISKQLTGQCLRVLEDGFLVETSMFGQIRNNWLFALRNGISDPPEDANAANIKMNFSARLKD